MDIIFNQLKEKVKIFLSTDGSGHDYRHAERVFRSACKIQSQEGGDLLIIGSAALVHDICRPREKKTGKSHFGDEALEIIHGVLNDLSLYTSEQIHTICEVVKYHDIYDRDNPMAKSIELQIVQDADNLDAIGALGIGRTFTFGGAYGLPMYDPEFQPNTTQAFVDGPGHHTPTSIGHFYEKMLKLSTYMNTSTGKTLGKARHIYMQEFLTQFFAEREGER